MLSDPAGSLGSTAISRLRVTLERYYNSESQCTSCATGDSSFRINAMHKLITKDSVCMSHLPLYRHDYTCKAVMKSFHSCFKQEAKTVGGLRQFSVLSPILFAIYVNNFQLKITLGPALPIHSRLCIVIYVQASMMKKAEQSRYIRTHKVTGEKHNSHV